MKRQIAIGNTTKNFIICLMMLNKLHYKIYDVIVEMYDEGEAADDIMNGDFLEKTNELRALIEKYMCRNIAQKISLENFTEI